MSEVYTNLEEFVSKLAASPPITRRDFLRQVRFAVIQNPPECVGNQEMLMAIGCAMAWKCIRSDVKCPLCGVGFRLGMVSREGSASVVWRGPSPAAVRHRRGGQRCWCYARRRPVGCGILSGVHMVKWMDFLETNDVVRGLPKVSDVHGNWWG